MTKIYGLKQGERFLYVGRTNHPKATLKIHQILLRLGYHPNAKLQRAVSEEEPIKMEILDVCSTAASLGKKREWHEAIESRGMHLCSTTTSEEQTIDLVKLRREKRKSQWWTDEKKREAAASRTTGVTKFQVIDWLEEDLSRCYLGLGVVMRETGAFRLTAYNAMNDTVQKHNIVRPRTPYDYEELVPYNRHFNA